MRVLVVGGGAREHAIVWKLRLSPRVTDIYCAPGNGGTAALAHNVPISAEDVIGLAHWASQNRIELTVVGPEAPLAKGLVDHFEGLGLRAFGPSSAAATIETSKVWAKAFMDRHGIPSPRAVEASNLDLAEKALADFDYPLVIKADGLAAGKGVRVVRNQTEAQEALEDCFLRRVYGPAGDRALLQEYVEGTELSVLAFCDGRSALPMVPARDYKRLLDDDEGPNTGGMGSYAPVGFLEENHWRLILESILRPAVLAMDEEGRPYKGVLYAGLMITAQGPKVLEFNCRFGDPEAQVILPLLRTDLLEVIEAVIEGRLDQMRLDWAPGACCGVVLASQGYPVQPQVGQSIHGLDSLPDGVLAFHAGTSSPKLSSPKSNLWGIFKSEIGLSEQSDYGLFSAGGRVLTVVATGPDVEAARQSAYAGIEVISLEGGHYRRDLAKNEARTARTAIMEGGLLSTRNGVFPLDIRPSSVAQSRPTLWGRPVTIDAGSAGSQQVAAASPTAGREAESPMPFRTAGAGTSTAIAAIIMGSESDLPAMEGAVQVLQSLGIPHEVIVMSAHRTPDRVRSYALSLSARGIKVVIAGAGGAAHLPGVLASWTEVPVIGVPLPSTELKGVDALYSMAQMPAGVPVATVGIGSAGAKNAAYLAAAILSVTDQEIKERYRTFRDKQRQGEA